MQYTRDEFINAINRELKLRQTTYPKMVEKKQKQWEMEGEDVMSKTIELTTEQRIQYELLALLKKILLFDIPTYNNEMIEVFRELQRELRMRKQYYPRWVRFGRMNEDAAAIEISVWSELTKFYHETYCPDAPWRKPKAKATGDEK